MENKKITAFYYLRVNGEILIDFNGILGFESMEDYLRLNIFTGSFKSKKDLIEGLRHLNLIPKDLIVSEIDIVRRVGNKNEGYSYRYITDTLISNAEIGLLSPGTIIRFFHTNSINSEMIKEMVSYYKDGLEKKVRAKQKSIGYIKKSLELLPECEEAEELRTKIEKESNSLEKFTRELVNLQKVAHMANLYDNYQINTLDQMNEYMNRIYIFISDEIYYYRNGKKYRNNRGLVKMAKFISRMLRKYDDLEAPLPTFEHDKLVWEFKTLMKKDYSEKPSKPRRNVAALIDDDTVDPDEFMFLEEDDYDDLGMPEDALEDALLNLEEMQGGTKRF